MSTLAWFPDPTGRHQYRWWDGERWTHYVADDGVATSDPVAGLDELSAPTNPQGTETGQIELVGRKANLGDGRTVTLASPGARLGAWLIDGSLLAIPLFAPAFFLLDIPEDEDISWTDTLTDIGGGVLPSTLGDWVFYLLAFAITFVYQVVFIATKGQTLGKMAAGVQVVGFEDGSIPGFSRAVRRWAIPGLLGLIPFVGIFLGYICYLSLTWRRNRQGWHDSLANTVVVRVNRAVHKDARWARTHDLQPVLLATPGARIGARLVDAEIFSVLWLIILIANVYAFDAADVEGSALPFLFVLVVPVIVTGLIYEVVMIATRGQTLGKMAMGIKVVRADNGARPGAGKSLGRWSLPYLILLIPLLGWLFTLLCYLSLTWGRDRQGWHDKAAGTLVTVK